MGRELNRKEKIFLEEASKPVYVEAMGPSNHFCRSLGVT